MYLKPERTEWIGISIGRWLLVWLCVPVLIIFVSLLCVDLHDTKQVISRQQKVICSLIERLDYQAQELAWTRADLQETQDEILVWHTRTTGEMPKKGNKK